MDRKVEQELYSYCRAHKNITWLIKTIGQWDFEIGAETKTQQDLQRVLSQLKKQFAGAIQPVEPVPVLETLKYCQYPFAPK